MSKSRAEELVESMCRTPASDGKPANIYILNNNQGMQVALMDIGATWLSCEVPVAGQLRQVMIGVSTMLDHLKQTGYLGATVGRYANRIAAGSFDIAGEKYQVDINQSGNTLHGGPLGFDKRRWDVEQENEQKITFSLYSEDGDQGFPGNLQVKVTYQLDDLNELSISYVATTDKPCPVNLTNHAYFNLQGEAETSCLQHQLRIAAQQYVPVNEVGIPLGHFNTVSESSFDFRELKEIGRDFLACPEQKMAGGYDHAFLLEEDHQDGNKVAVHCISPDKMLSLEMKTTKPTVQVYTGNYLAGTPNRKGGEYINHCAFALESEFAPDAPNHPEWSQPSCILLPEDSYRHKTRYRFVVSETKN